MPADNREPVLTRIKNNQIVDQTITEAKVANFALSGGKLANNLVYGSNLTISGNLTVSGTTTTVDTTNTLIADPLLVLSKNATGTASIDSGLVIERGTDTNVVFLWKESADEFVLAYSDETGTTAGSVVLGEYANLRVAGFAANSITAASLTGNVTSTGTTNLAVVNASGQVTFNGNIASSTTATGTLVITGDAGGLGLAGNINVGGVANIGGNLTAGNVAATTVTGNVVSSGTSNLAVVNVSNVLTLTDNTASTDSTTGAFKLTGGAGIGGNVYIGGVLGVTGNISGGNVSGATLTGNVVSSGTTNLAVLNANGQVTFSASTASTDKDTGALVISNGGLGVEGNVNVGAAVGVTGNLVAGNVAGATLTGNVVSNGTSLFANIGANASVTFTDGTASTSTGSGALRLTGGAGIGGNINVGGSNSSFTAATASTSTDTGAVVVTGGVGVGGNINVGGTVSKFTANTASSSHTTGAVVVAGGLGVGGDINVDGSVIINQNLVVKGTTTTVNSVTTQLVDPIFQLGGGPNGAALTDDDSKDRGISFKYYDGNAERTGFFGYDDSTGNFTFVPNATISDEIVSGTLGTVEFGTVLAKATTASDGTNSGALVVSGGAGVAGNLNVGGAKSTFTSNVASSSTSSGAVVVTGGVGVGGNIYAGGDVVATGNVSAAAFAAPTFTGNLISSGVSNLTTVNVSNVLTSSDATASTSTTTGAVKVAGGVGVQGNINVGGSDSRFTAATASTNTTSGAVVVTGGVGVGGDINVGGAANIAGNVTAGNVAGTTLTGNVSSTGTSSFSTATFSTLANVTGVEASTTTSSGSLRVSGGVGVAGNINVGGTVSKFTGTTESTSNATGAVTVGGGVGIAGNLYAANISVVDNTVATVNTNANLVLQPNGTGATIINSSGAASDTIIRGDTDNNLFYVDASADNIGVGTDTPNAEAKLHINATNSMIIPVGNVAQRPATPVRGMMRYNTGVEDIEFWDGTMWQIASQDFTVITTESFTGDGSTVAFTLNAAATTASCIVSVQGVVQQPVISYGVAGTTLTFTEAPQAGDVIEVRKLTTTGSISLDMTEGYANIALINNSILLRTGTTAETTRVEIANTGVVTMSANVASTSTTSGTLVVTGGIGASGNVYAARFVGNGAALTGVIADNFGGGSVSGATTFTANTDSTSTSTGTVIVQGGVGVSGNVYGGTFYGSGAGLTSIPGANVTGTVSSATSAGSATTAATVTTNAQPNITSVGTLTSLTVTGNVSAGNVSGTLLTGTLATAAQPNITSVGTLTSLTVTGNVSAGTFYGSGAGLTNLPVENFNGGTISNALAITANTASTSYLTGALTVAGGVGVSGNLFANNVGTTTLTAGSAAFAKGLGGSPSTSALSGTVTISGGLGVTGNIYTGGIVDIDGFGFGEYTATSTSTGALRVRGGVGVTGNVHAARFVGDGSGLTNLSVAAFNGGSITNALVISNSTVSTSATTGALQVSGGTGLSGNLFVGTGGLVRILSQSASTDIANGALVVSGGVGVSGNLNVGSRATIAGNVALNSSTDSTSWSTGALTVSGGVGIGGNVYLNTTGRMIISNTATSASSTTGALTIAGGFGTGGSSYIGGSLSVAGSISGSQGSFTNTVSMSVNVASTSTSSGTLQVTGGVGVTGNVYAAAFYGDGSNLTNLPSQAFTGGNVANAVNITATTASTSSTTGALRVAGGAGFGGNVWFGSGGVVRIQSTTAATSSNSGALVVTGGVGLNNDLRVGGNQQVDGTLYVASGTASTSTGSGTLTVAGGVGVTGNVHAARFVGDGSGLTGITASSATTAATVTTAAQPNITSVGTLTSLTSAGQVTFSGNIASTSTSTGTVVISGTRGGLGVAGNVYVGLSLIASDIDCSGISRVLAGDASTSTTTGALRVTGGAGFGGNVFSGGTISAKKFVVTDTGISDLDELRLSSTKASTSTGSGALTVPGGVGVAGNVYATAFYGNGAGLTGLTASSATTAATVTTNAQPNITSVGTLTSLTVSGNLSAGNVSVTTDLTVTGNLTVNGTTTTINSTTVAVDDKNLVLGDVATPTDTTADGGGITLKGATDKTIIWSNTSGRWSFNTGIDATSIQNTPIGNATASSGAFTTLTASGATTFTANTASTSGATGAVVVTGGVGIGGDLYVTGNVTATDVNSLSDARLKDDVQTIESALDKTLALRGVSYTMRSTGVRSVGVIAQEIEQVLPEVVSTAADGIKSVSYGNVVGLLIEAIKEQQRQIDELRAQLANK